MQALELKIPPPIVALLVAVAMWGISRFFAPAVVLHPVRGLIAAVIALPGLGIAVSGAVAFRRAKTTVNPMKPQATSSLVTSGIYRFTRNPMYVGLLCLLTAWAVLLGTPVAFVGPVIFVPYMNRFQIVPEERALAALFGTDYAAYQRRVRRWL